MFGYYFSIIFFTVFLMVVMKMLVLKNELLSHEKKIKLDIVSTLLIVASLAEAAGCLMDGSHVVPRTLHIIVKTLELSVAPFISVVCADILCTVKHKKLAAGLLCTHAALEIVSAFLGFIFYVDAQNVYHHGSAYLIYIIALLTGIALFAFEIVAASRRQYGMRKTLMLMLPLFAVCGLVFEYVGDRVHVIWLCSAIDVMLMYMIDLEQTQDVDALTHLLNRRYYDGRITHLKEAATVFYFDVDYFKEINDNYGHSFGDVTLAAVADCIQASFGRAGYCYRIGGDEFSVIAYCAERAAGRYVADFHRRMNTIRAEDSRFPWVSVGYSTYVPGKNNIDEVIKQADAMMYQDKRNGKTSGHSGHHNLSE